MKLADRTTRIAGSPTMKVTATVDRLRRAGVEVIDFGAGEPDFPTPAPVKAAAHDALDHDFTKYTPAAGITSRRPAATSASTMRSQASRVVASGFSQKTCLPASMQASTYSSWVGPHEATTTASTSWVATRKFEASMSAEPPYTARSMTLPSR